MIYDLTIQNVNVVTSKDTFYGGVAVKDGVIACLFIGNEAPESARTIDGMGKWLIPGGVDAHVHIRYPGSAHRENFLTGTQAAAAGGTTTIVEHPISTPPQYSPEILQKRVEAMEEQSIVDCAFLGAAGGEYLDEIERVGRAGIVGYKTFLHAAPEGREAEFQGLTSRNNYELQQVLRRIKQTGLLAAAHTEDNDLVVGNIADLRRRGETYPLAHCLSRPPVVEVLAVQRLLTLAQEIGARVYLVHISTPEAVELAQEARAKGMEIYLETCPQYLYMDETYLEKYGAYAKCNPALRTPETVEKMWKYIENGAFDVVSSDHAPYTVEEKERDKRDIFVAPAGFPGLETRIPFMMKAVKDGRISLTRAVQLLCTNPARIYGLEAKGDIAPGKMRIWCCWTRMKNLSWTIRKCIPRQRTSAGLWMAPG